LIPSLARDTAPFIYWGNWVLQRLHLFLTDDYRLQRSAVECQTGEICSFRVLRVVTHCGSQGDAR
jgi:hypothetical protein